MKNHSFQKNIHPTIKELKVWVTNRCKAGTHNTGGHGQQPACRRWWVGVPTGEMDLPELLMARPHRSQKGCPVRQV